MDDERLFDVEEIPEVPLFRVPRRSRGENDARFRNDYPPEWDCCQACGGTGTRSVWLEVKWGYPWAIHDSGVKVACSERIPNGVRELHRDEVVQKIAIEVYGEPKPKCPDCLGMGSLKARVRLEAGHRCVRCKHPYIPKGDAKMLGLEPSGLHDCETCGATGRVPDTRDDELAAAARTLPCPACKGPGRRWTPWSACDGQCTHGAPWRYFDGAEWHPYFGITETEADLPSMAGMLDLGRTVEAEWRILTVHHLSGDKADVRWGNLVALCQRCHLEIQAKVVLERIYPHEHSEWFKPHAAWWYAVSYLGEELDRDEVMGRIDELLALERVA